MRRAVYTYSVYYYYYYYIYAQRTTDVENKNETNKKLQNSARSYLRTDPVALCRRIVAIRYAC